MAISLFEAVEKNGQMSYEEIAKGIESGEIYLKDENELGMYEALKHQYEQKQQSQQQLQFDYNQLYQDAYEIGQQWGETLIGTIRTEIGEAVNSRLHEQQFHNEMTLLTVAAVCVALFTIVAIFIRKSIVKIAENLETMAKYIDVIDSNITEMTEIQENKQKGSN